MTYVGINGFGRIGKAIFLQLLNNKQLDIKAINVPDFNIHNLESYLKHDSSHTYDTNFELEIISNNKFRINGNIIYFLSDRDASQLNWRSYGINHVIDSTGAYLTYNKCMLHNVDYVIMCAPPKDNTPQFVVNVNHNKYNGEHIVSNASCTTNSICPVLQFINETYGIKKANFTTIHAATASQNVIDTNKFKNRTSRSVINNIIPHTTGASKSITKLIPSLENKIKGTSVRVPVSNVSMIDLNVTMLEKVNFEHLMEQLESCNYIVVNKENLVSSDFNTTCVPSIIDKPSSFQLIERNSENEHDEFKLMIWYDNEWSYSSQVVKLLEHMVEYNEKNNGVHPHYIENFDYKNKNILLRVDWNIPYDKNTYTINDNFRIKSSLKTIDYLLEKKVNRIVIVSHLGRPRGNGYEEIYSWTHFIEQVQTFFSHKIKLLNNCISNETIEELNKNEHKIYLLENILFHTEETNFKNIKYSETISLYNKLGDFFINDAFGCMHREHLSIVGFNKKERAYGFLVHKELECLKIITKHKNREKVLAIVGGGKMDDKIILLEQLSKKVDGIYITGGNINSILKIEKYKNYIEKIKNNKASIYFMCDGIGGESLDTNSSYYNKDNLPENTYFYDIGMQSIIDLNNIIQEYDIIFWNGTLGVVENELYSYGSQTLVELLIKSKKKVIVGGGDTACFVNKKKHNFYYVSTGGGASISYISDGSLVGYDYFM